MAEELGGILIKLSVNSGEFVKELNDIEKKMQGFKELGEKLQKTGLVISAMGASVVGSFGLMFKSFADNADALSKMSQKTGIAVESLQELKYAADLSGTSIDSVLVGVRYLSKAVTEARDGNQQYLDSFKNLKINIEELQGLNPEEQFYKIAGAIADIKNPTERTARAIEFFGRSGTELLPMLKNGSDGLKQMAEEFRKYGVAIDEGTAQAAEEFNDTLDRIKTSFSGLFGIISAQMLPIMQSLAYTISDTVVDIKNFVSENRQLVTTATKIVVVIGTLTLAFGGLLTAVGTLLALMPLIASSIAIIFSPISLVIGGIVALGAAIALVYKNWSFILLQMQKAWAVFVDVVIAGVISVLQAFARIPFLSKRVNESIANLNQMRLENAKNIAEKQAKYEEEYAKKSTDTQKKENKTKTDSYAAMQKDITDELRKAEDARIAYQKSMFDSYSNAEKKVVLENEKDIISQRLKLAKIGTQEYYTILQQQYENQKALNELGNYEMVSGYNNALNELKNRTINYKDVIVGIYDNMQSGIASSFETLFTDLSNGFADFGAFATSVGNAIKGALIKAFAEIAAQWIMQHVIMKAATLAWKAIEISAAAAVGAARAAAASAWSLWGAIAIGASIGAGILAMAGAFANGGIVGGTSMSGDNLIARVNSGEMILNSSQQSKLWNMINSGEVAGKNSEIKIEQNFEINSNGNNLEDLTQAIRKGTTEALEFAGLTYNVGAKQGKVVI